MEVEMHIKQRNSRDCGIAALCMVTNHKYEDVIAYFGADDIAQRGVYLRGMDDYLVDHGYAIARKSMFMGWFRTESGGQVHRQPWPPEPFGHIHLCEVDAAENSPCHHFVVMLHNGVVLDPLGPEHKKLTDYHKVLNVAAISRQVTHSHIG
jgi:hypothetical protein